MTRNMFYALAALATPGVAHASYGMAGCGLGSLAVTADATDGAFGDTNGILQIFAATTNNIFWNQTFAITFGVSNCTTEGLVLTDKEQEAFVEANFDAWQRDIAAGGGEHLAAFTTLLGCDDAVRPEVYAAAQRAYPSTFPSASTQPAQALTSRTIQLTHEPPLIGACTRI